MTEKKTEAELTDGQVRLLDTLSLSVLRQKALLCSLNVEASQMAKRIEECEREISLAETRLGAAVGILGDVHGLDGVVRAEGRKLVLVG